MSLFDERFADFRVINGLLKVSTVSSLAQGPWYVFPRRKEANKLQLKHKLRTATNRVSSKHSCY